MNWLLRIWLWTGVWSRRLLGRDPIWKMFPKVRRQQIAQAVAAAERNTSGEIVVHIINRCDRDLCKEFVTPAMRTHEQAIRLFNALGVYKTRDKTGVLLLVVLEDRWFEILADVGINAKLPHGFLDSQAEHLAKHFKQASPTEGIRDVVVAIGTVLHKHFPRKDDDTNELGDEPTFGEGRN